MSQGPNQNPPTSVVGVVPKTNTGAKAGITTGIVGFILAAWLAISPFLPTTIKDRVQPVIDTIDENKEKFSDMEDKIDNLINIVNGLKNEDSPPTPPVAIDIKVVDTLGKDLTSFTIGSPFVVTASTGKTKEWTNQTGKATLLPVPDGFVVIPQDADILIFTVRVGTSSAIKVLKSSQPEPEDQTTSRLNSIQGQLKELTSAIDSVEGDVESIQGSFKTLENRVAALESPRPPPKPDPVPLQEYHLSLFIVENPLQRTVATASVLNELTGWNTLKDQGHDWRIYDVADTSTDAVNAKACLTSASIPYPGLVIKRKETGICYWGPLPKTLDEIKQLVTKYAGPN